MSIKKTISGNLSHIDKFSLVMKSLTFLFFKCESQRENLEVKNLKFCLQF